MMILLSSIFIYLFDCCYIIMRTLFILLLFIIPVFAYAQKPVNTDSLDTSTKDKPWRVTRDEFIQKYTHNNDTLVLLTELWYQKRRTAIAKIAGIPVSFLVMFGAAAITQGNQSVAVPYSMLGAGVAFSTNGLVQLSVYSRKELYKTVQDYEAGKPIPPVLLKRAMERQSRKDYTLNQADFLARHGSDDTSKALIRMFYRKRNEGYTLTSFLFSSVLTTMAVNRLDIDLQSGPNSDVIIPFGTMIAYCVIVLPSIPISIIGLVQSQIYNRKKLCRIIRQRQQGIKTDPKIIHKLKPKDFLIKKSRLP